MTQNLLSRLFGAGSIYETFNDDAESSAGGYNNPSQSTYFQVAQSHLGMSFNPYTSTGKSRALDPDEAVPVSLMYEGQSRDEPAAHQARAEPLYGTRINQELPPRPDETPGQPQPQWQPDTFSTPTSLRRISEKDRAIWKWANVNNLDIFLNDVYRYFLGNGIYSMLLKRVLDLLSVAFLVSFSTYLWGCIDYSKIRTSTSLTQIQTPKCVSNLDSKLLLILWLIALVWCIKVMQLFSDLRTLWEMHNFYTHLLDITEIELQTISWQEITSRMLALRNANPITSNAHKHASQSQERMDAHDIANRLMRKENYLVAMFNKEIIDVSLPILGRSQVVTWILEWNLSMCIFGFIFDESGQIRPAFVRESGNQRKALVEGLKRRFYFAAIMNLFLAVVLIIYLPCRFFLEYFSEYHKNPSSIGSRRYTPYAQWKFREFNELPHIFQKRLTLSHKYADTYVSQFPNDKMTQLARFVSFVTGSFAAVLALISLIDSDLFLGFEITHDRTVLFYLGLFGTVAAISRSMIPSDSETFDPEASLLAVIEFTHYSPKKWNGKYHTQETKADFCKLYDYQLVIFVQEIISILAVPFILWFKLPGSSESIIDFFKDFSMHVDGIGYVCSFAVFDFERHGNTKYGAPVSSEDPAATQGRTRRQMRSKEGKMEKSFLNFKASNPDWTPDASGSQFLQNLQTKTFAVASTQSNPAVPLAFGGRSPYKSSRKPAAGDSYAAQSSRARRGLPGTGALEASANMTSTIYHPASRPSRIAEETNRDMLGESFLDTAQKVPSDAQQEQHVTAGVLGLMHQFYQEAGTHTSRL